MGRIITKALSALSAKLPGQILWLLLLCLSLPKHAADCACPLAAVTLRPLLHTHTLARESCGEGWWKAQWRLSLCTRSHLLLSALPSANRIRGQPEKSPLRWDFASLYNDIQRMLMMQHTSICCAYLTFTELFLLFDDVAAVSELIRIRLTAADYPISV